MKNSKKIIAARGLTSDGIFLNEKLEPGSSIVIYTAFFNLFPRLFVHVLNIEGIQKFERY